jgi:hypothetical protein
MLGPLVSNACSCISVTGLQETPAEAFDAAEVVAKVSVVNVTDTRWFDNSTLGGLYRLFMSEAAFERHRRERMRITGRTMKVFKGPARSEIVFFTAENEALCGVNFETNRVYVVYLFMESANGHLIADLCSRTSPVQRADEDLAWLEQRAISR